ncbi:MAG: ribonuclease D, partial [Actinobacteria bacterium]|nr:ribonuclease D [Actinomycetota bacterium]
MSEEKTEESAEDLSLPIAVPLLQPSGGTPPVIDTTQALTQAISKLENGSGPFAIDAER